jgi:hypothetical protein
MSGQSQILCRREVMKLSKAEAATGGFHQLRGARNDAVRKPAEEKEAQVAGWRIMQGSGVRGTPQKLA